MQLPAATNLVTQLVVMNSTALFGHTAVMNSVEKTMVALWLGLIIGPHVGTQSPAVSPGC